MSEIAHAHSITLGVCDSCDAIHINFLDDEGVVFATAALPAACFDSFLAQFASLRVRVFNRSTGPLQ